MKTTLWDWQKLLASIAILWALIFLAYSNSFSNAFQFDDTHTIQSNIFIRSLAHAPRYFVDPSTSSYRPENSGYRPMTTLFSALGFAVSQNSPWGYHLLKIAEHALVATLLFFLALKLLPQNLPGFLGETRPWIAFFAALLFGVNRVHTEVVNYISAVSSLQAGLFFLAAFFCYVLARPPAEAVLPSAKKKIGLLTLSALFFLCSVWSKEEGITLPAIVLAYEWFYRKERRWKVLFFSALPYIAVALFFIVARQTLMQPIADTSRGDASRFIYAITQLRSWFHYGFLFFWPLDLNADNLNFDFSPGLWDWRVWACLAVHTAIWYWAYCKRFAHPFYTFAVIWVYVTVLPASSVFQLVEAVNEHRAYIPYMFLSMLGVLLAAQALQKVILKKKNLKRLGFVLASLATLLLTAGTYARNQVWRSEESLWTDIYNKNPNSVRAMNVLGVTLFNADKIGEAEKLLVKCRALAPAYLPCKVHLSMVFAEQKRFTEGKQVLEEGLGINPNYPHLNFHYGVYLKDFFGQLDMAEKHFLLVQRLTEGRFFQADIKLAEIWFERKKPETGIAILQKLFEIDPQNGDAWDAMARGQMLAGNLAQAKEIATNLYRLSASDRHCLILANINERLGQLEEAFAYYNQAVVANPKAIQGWQGIARVGLALKRPAPEATVKVQDLLRSKNWVWISALFLPADPSATNRPGMR